MKRVIAIILAATALTAQAGYPGHHMPRVQHHHHAHGGGWGWVVPAVIGGAIVYGATRPAQAQTPVIVQPVPQPGQVITCPPGTMPFTQNGWVQNQFGQWIQTNYVECK